MNNVNFLVTNMLIGGSVVAILLLRWRRNKQDGSRWILPYPWAVKILAIVGLMIVYTGASITVELVEGVAKVLVILMSIPAAGMAFLAATEVFTSETSYDEYTLCHCSPWRKSVLMPFDDVVRIYSPPLLPLFVIHSKNGETIRILKWNEQAEEVLGYAQEGLESRNAPDIAGMLA